MTAAGLEPSDGNGHPKDGKLRILIAEDYEDDAASMALLLRLSGHEVVVARDGRAAVEMAQARRPDVVLLDLGLPLMNGYDVAKTLSGPRPARTPLLVAVTCWGREEDRRHSREAGIDLHLLKPVDPIQLQVILSRFYMLIHGTPTPCERSRPF